MPPRSIKGKHGLLILVSLHRAMEKVVLRGEEWLSLFSGVPFDTIINLN
jgi:hypothetical protein